MAKPKTMKKLLEEDKTFALGNLIQQLIDETEDLNKKYLKNPKERQRIEKHLQVLKELQTEYNRLSSALTAAIAMPGFYQFYSEREKLKKGTGDAKKFEHSVPSVLRKITGIYEIKASFSDEALGNKSISDFVPPVQSKADLEYYQIVQNAIEAFAKDPKKMQEPSVSMIDKVLNTVLPKGKKVSIQEQLDDQLPGILKTAKKILGDKITAGNALLNPEPVAPSQEPSVTKPSMPVATPVEPKPALQEKEEAEEKPPVSTVQTKPQEDPSEAFKETKKKEELLTFLSSQSSNPRRSSMVLGSKPEKTKDIKRAKSATNIYAKSTAPDKTQTKKLRPAESELTISRTQLEPSKPAPQSPTTSNVASTSVLDQYDSFIDELREKYKKSKAKGKHPTFLHQIKQRTTARKTQIKLIQDAFYSLKNDTNIKNNDEKLEVFKGALLFVRYQISKEGNLFESRLKNLIDAQILTLEKNTSEKNTSSIDNSKALQAFSTYVSREDNKAVFEEMKNLSRDLAELQENNFVLPRTKKSQ